MYCIEISFADNFVVTVQSYFAYEYSDCLNANFHTVSVELNCLYDWLLCRVIVVMYIVYLYN